MKTVSFYATLCLLLGLSGCASYRARPLGVFASNVVPGKENTLSMDTYLFTPRDCRMYLDRNVLAKGYQPIHIRITNNSSQTFHFSVNDINLPTIAPDVVARRMHTNTVGRVVGYGIVGLFIWPFLIPAIVDGVESEKANVNLDLDFSCKSLHNHTIAPYGSVSGLIFVPAGQVDFTVRAILTSCETGKKVVLNNGCLVDLTKEKKVKYQDVTLRSTSAPTA